MTPTGEADSKTTFGTLMFLEPGSGAWKPLVASAAAGEPQVEGREAEVTTARGELRAFLLSSLQMQHVVVLAGSGTSLGSTTGGPSMPALWEFCTAPEDAAERKLAEDVIADIRYRVAEEGENIEALLSRCEAFLPMAEKPNIAAFISSAKGVILDKCSNFLKAGDEKQLAAHRTFLHRLSRRRARDSRLKLFTTNYDLCFENAAGKQGLVVLDGFSFTQPRSFDPRFFSYDIVRRAATGEDFGTPLEGVFHLYKLHGSVNWARRAEGAIEIDPAPTPENACLIYPAKGKYQQSYVQPHLELVSQYFAALREPNTCLIVVGYGFNDDHLSEPILAAAQTNPHLRLIVVDPSADDLTARANTENRYWKALLAMAKRGDDIWLINSLFEDFASLIPDLKSLTPAQQLERDIRRITQTQ